MNKVKTGANINKVTIKLSNYSSIKLSNFTQKKKKRIGQSNKVFSLKERERETLISLSDFQSSDKRERERQREVREKTH